MWTGGTLQIEFGTGRITGPEARAGAPLARRPFGPSVQAVDDFHIGPFSVFNQTFGGDRRIPLRSVGGFLLHVLLSGMNESEEGRVFEEAARREDREHSGGAPPAMPKARCPWRASSDWPSPPWLHTVRRG